MRSLSEYCNVVQILESSQLQLCYWSIEHSLTLSILQIIIRVIKTEFVKQSYLSQSSLKFDHNVDWLKVITSTLQETV
jgi:C4-dicarboxylate transporter